jgi:hypothetical protein
MTSGPDTPSAAARSSATHDRSERQARFEDFAPDIVDIDVDAILRQRL